MFKDYLARIDACSQAIDWVGDKSSSEAWSQCEHPDWMFWLLRQHVRKDGWPAKEVFVQLAIDFARSVLHLVSEGEDRPLKAIEAAEKWLADPSEENSVAARAAAAAARAAADAAAYDAASYDDAAAYDAAADAAAYVAYTAASAASASAASASAASAARAAARAAAYAAAHAVADAAYAAASAVQKEQSQMIRNRIPAIPVCE